MASRAITNRRVGMGLCRCGGTPADGKKMCRECVAKVVVATRRLMAERKAAGLCRCGAQPSPGRKMCAPCLKRRVSEVAACVKKNKSRGLCACGRQPDATGISCHQCLRRRRENVQRLKEKGVCIACAMRAATNGKVTCDHCSEKSKVVQKRIAKRYRHKVLEYYGHKCNCCGESNYEFLTIDHVNNDGHQHRKEINLMSIYRWLVKNGFPPGFQVLCWNCNCAKAFYGACPHTAATRA